LFVSLINELIVRMIDLCTTGLQIRTIEVVIPQGRALRERWQSLAGTVAEPCGNDELKNSKIDCFTAFAMT
jgi:hypothetical protein